MDAETLDRCFKENGRKYGYDKVEAVFVDFRDLKVTWSRTCRRISFKVSDYLVEAPYDVVSALAVTVFSNINGGNARYPDILKAWLVRPEFVRNNQATYLERCEKHTCPADEGEAKNLYDSFDRLKASGLVEDIPDMKLLWMKDYAFRIRSYSSALMKTVMIAGELDSEDVPDYVVDWFLYREVCRVAVGFDINNRRHDRRISALEDLYLRRADAERWITERDREEDERVFGNDGSGDFTEKAYRTGPGEDSRCGPLYRVYRKCIL